MQNVVSKSELRYFQITSRGQLHGIEVS